MLIQTDCTWVKPTSTAYGGREYPSPLNRPDLCVVPKQVNALLPQVGDQMCESLDSESEVPALTSPVALV